MDATDRNALVAVPPALAAGALVPAATVREEVEAARAFAAAEKAAATRRAYRADWVDSGGRRNTVAEGGVVRWRVGDVRIGLCGPSCGRRGDLLSRGRSIGGGSGR